MKLIIVGEDRCFLQECEIATGQDSASIELTRLRDLDVRRQHEGAPFLSAASGLVRAGSLLYVVADDELHLGCFDLDDPGPGELVRLFAGELPRGKQKRKRAKPDLEILLELPPAAAAPHGSLLALGSGSGPQRRRGALLQLDERCRPAASPRVVDASGFFDTLALQVDDLNLEGAWIAGRTLHCLQRGHRGNSHNVVISLDLDEVLESLLEGTRGPTPLALHPMSLGECRGVPLSFSDACGLPDGRWLFTAVAEDTESSYEDGGFLGAAVGMAEFGRHGAVPRPLWIRPVRPSLKIEGVAAQMEAGALRLLFVTDADDGAMPAGLYEAAVLL